MNDLTVVIVAWKCKADLMGCLRSIDAAGSRFVSSVIVVDNNSGDGTVEMLRQEFQNVQVIENRENPGFAAANNQGLKVAQSRYMMLLNPDTIVRSGALDTMVRFMDEHPRAWAAGPAIYNRDGSRQQSGVRFPDNWNILCETFFLDRLFPHSKVFGRHKELYADMSSPRRVDYVQGSCLIVRSDVIEKVGGLDERFFMYFEETDWCYRINNKGGLVYLVPAAGVIHFGGGDAGHYDEGRLVQYHRSLLLFYGKHYSRLSSIFVRLIVMVRSLTRIVSWTAMALVKPDVRTSAMSSIRGYLHIPALIVGRRV